MKEHIQSKFVNELRDVAKTYAGCECLRDVLSGVVQKYVSPLKYEISELKETISSMKPATKECELADLTGDDGSSYSYDKWGGIINDTSHDRAF